MATGIPLPTNVMLALKWAVTIIVGCPCLLTDVMALRRDAVIIEGCPLSTDVALSRAVVISEGCPCHQM